MPAFLANYFLPFINYRLFTSHAPDCSVHIEKNLIDLLPQQFHDVCRLMSCLATLPLALVRPWSASLLAPSPISSVSNSIRQDSNV
jgi:hypothetical protein